MFSVDLSTALVPRPTINETGSTPVYTTNPVVQHDPSVVPHASSNNMIVQHVSMNGIPMVSYEKTEIVPLNFKSGIPAAINYTNTKTMSLNNSGNPLVQH